MALFLAFLVGSDRFATVTNNFFRVGHTHMKLDQRFSVVASKLSAAQELQTPADFGRHIEQHVKFQSGRLTTEIEMNTGAWNWQEWLSHLGVGLSGLTPTEKEPEVRNCWRFVQRRYLRDYVSAEIEARMVVPPGFEGDPVGPTDVIFLLKQYVCSTELAQYPELFLPAARPGKAEPQVLDATSAECPDS